MNAGAVSPMSSAALAGSESPSEASAQARKRAVTISIGTSAFIVSRLRGSVALLVSVLLSACGTLPTQVDRPFSPAQQPSADSPLVRIAQDSSPAPTLTGFRLMPDGFYSLDARIELARRARDSLDVQYYLIQDDRTGRLLMRNLRDAALRGVRVRLLVDDLYTVGGDPMFRGLAAFPNVEVRLFNPFCCARQSIASKYVASIADFRRLNHRMHNKLFIADGAIAVMGGRNIADEYFARSATSNFVDMDVFVVGPVVRQLAGDLRRLLEQPAGLSGGDHPRRIRRPRRGATKLRSPGRRRGADDVARSAAVRYPRLSAR